MKFYSPNGQDLHIYKKFVQKNTDPGVFIEIGADDGFENSNTASAPASQKTDLISGINPKKPSRSKPVGNQNHRGRRSLPKRPVKSIIGNTPHRLSMGRQ